MIVYVSIGNSDDKLSQREWSWFVRDVRAALHKRAKNVHGEWYSATSDSFQNACFCIEFRDKHKAAEAKDSVANCGKDYRQDSVAWAVAETEFI